MNTVTPMFQIQAQQVMVEVAGMEAENKCRESAGNSPAYAEDSFLLKANELASIHAALREAWQNEIAT